MVPARFVGGIDYSKRKLFIALGQHQFLEFYFEQAPKRLLHFYEARL